MKIKIGLYGSNGHQIQNKLINHPLAELVAVAELDAKSKSEINNYHNKIKYYNTLDELLADDSIDLISLCSPIRRQQARDAVKCLKRGKHVYAEKPCAMSEEELDLIIKTAKDTGKCFHEMAGTAFEQPYLAMQQIVKSGEIGTVVQVFAQKSYPYYEGRPQNEDIDGGLICQNGVHALRFIEHVAGQKIIDISAVQTKLGNPYIDGGLMMAASLIMTLENGGVASAVVNYLNPTGFKSWGNEHLRIFGTSGFVESIDGGAKTRLLVKDSDLGELDLSHPSKDYFDIYMESLHEKSSMPFCLYDELHPTRMVIRAYNKAKVNN